MIKKVVVTGPECTGKSNLSKFLAEHYRTKWVPEFAREFLDNLGRPYLQQDLLEIAKGQLALEDAMAGTTDKLLICDTNLYVIKVWSNFKYGSVDPFILSQIRDRKYDLYLLTYVDIPWEEDPQRENPHEREALFDIYLQEMQNQSVPFVVIRGDQEERPSTAIAAIDKLMGA